MTGTSWCGLLQVTIEVIEGSCFLGALSDHVSLPTTSLKVERHQRPSKCLNEVYMPTCMSLLHAFNQAPTCNVDS